MRDRHIAHVLQTSTDEWVEHSLLEHLKDVGNLSKSFASMFGNGDWACLAGLWHDLGKYKPEFQKYIRTASGYQADAHLENNPGKVDHSATGAIHACQCHPGIGRILAYLLAGHHSGLPDWYKDETKGRGLEDRLEFSANGDKKQTRFLEQAKADVPEEILNAPLPASKPPAEAEHAHLWIRMLFSCLVDADFLDTEAFMDPEQSESRTESPNLNDLFDLFMCRMRERDEMLRKKDDRGQIPFDLPINQIRRHIFESCKKSAELKPGFFSLTVPTGGGKTLSSMAFALKHALTFGKRRIIVVIPYTSIIEQTAKTLSDILGPDNVLEHHSNLDPDKETVRGRLAAENWNAPIVVTTNVQLFESLFASRTSRCRKLHNSSSTV